MLIWLLIVPLLICVSSATAENENEDTLRSIKMELEKLKYSNNLRDLVILDLERQVRDNRMNYEADIRKQESRIAELELRRSTSEKRKIVQARSIIEENTADSQNDIPSRMYRHKRQLGVGIGFSAYLSHHSTNLGHQHTIPFDSVILNEGRAFNTNTHEFTCPVSGVYNFQTALLSQTNDIAITEIVKEGIQLVQAHAEARNAGSTFDQGFNSVVTKCKKGESVWVRNFQHFGSAVYGERYTTFTGFLLWEMEEVSPSIVG